MLSGVYFGDKLSPLSDSVLLASSMCGVEIRAHIKGMLPISLTGYIITAILFAATSLVYQGHGNLEQINLIMEALQEHFYITPLVFLPPALVMLLLAFRQPAFPVISMGGVLGIVAAVYLQSADTTTAIASLWTLPSLNFGLEFIDTLLSRGGMLSVMPSVAMIIFGLGFGSLLVKVGIVKLLANKLERYVTNEVRLTGSTLLTAFLGNLLGSAMYVSLILTPKTDDSHQRCTGCRSSSSVPQY